jgi:hypothetical protein
MSDPLPWQPPPEGTDLEQGPMLLPQEMYDHLMSLPPGTDVTHYFEFKPGWDLTVTTGEREAWDTTKSSPDTSGKDAS